MHDSNDANVVSWACDVYDFAADEFHRQRARKLSRRKIFGAFLQP